MSILNLKHTGISVMDLEKTIEFYEFLGMKLLKRLRLDEAYCCNCKNLYLLPDGTSADVCFMEADNGTQIEFFQFNSPQPFVPSAWSKAGYTHISFQTDDIDSMYRKVTDLGCKILLPLTKGLTQTFFFFSDPEGRTVEIGCPYSGL